MRITLSTKPLYDLGQVEEIFKLCRNMECKIEILENEEMDRVDGDLITPEKRKKIAVDFYEMIQRKEARENGLLDFAFGRYIYNKLETKIREYKYNSAKEDK